MADLKLQRRSLLNGDVAKMYTSKCYVTQTTPCKQPYEIKQVCQSNSEAHYDVCSIAEQADVGAKACCTHYFTPKQVVGGYGNESILETRNEEHGHGG